ncbi:hypothetical protein CGRA01v4_12481 [Colletotrichum graminicola]|uniref:DUF676 domain-containing protein n=1 Tax=Colletotrichum graminicola (strain M1.001 / M2 / FGSC 10212) TaxID=645133 RepID=E3QT02_COLGM|nr:uncharacterized protein GLRG_09134 [Colletotrichum graminicola M1.001]EFQ33990.1 hypothetical protein GLRG_09134 [Colletotrichum graminicola M1.001]WDK21192.1 hypothetical protein CGRA01v4_12481 [Colletotrichum graminicola]
MSTSSTPTGPVTVLQSVEKQRNCMTTKLQVTDSHAPGPGNTTTVQATLPEYHVSPPWQLLWDDLWLFVRHSILIPFIVDPLWYPRRDGTQYPSLSQAWLPRGVNWNLIQRAVTASQSWYQALVDPFFPSGEMDELYPSVGNLISLTAHGILIVAQVSFLVSIPFVASLPFNVVIPYILGFIALNYFVCMPLNAGTSNGMLTSQHDRWEEARHWDSLRNDDYREKWIFLNGISVGSHWLQGNLNRLSRTFHRPIVGVHNPTVGIVFDIIQCLLERCFYFGTSDTRTCYALIAAALSPTEKTDKVVLILHSQGGLEGSIILDWLLSNYPRDTLKKMEIYTFGNAANHFNNPRVSGEEGTLGHIEHYGNSGDFVAAWGVNHFKSLVAKASLNQDLERKARSFDLGYILGRDERQNNFSGLLFKNEVKGHLLNQHYLDRILPLNVSLTGVEEESKGKPMPGTFMDSPMQSDEGSRKLDREGARVYQESRLWQYINGRSPPLKVKALPANFRRRPNGERTQ